MTLPDWVVNPALARVWTVLGARLEDRGLRAEGRVLLTGLTRAERHAASALIGRPVTAARLALDLAELDSWLAERSGIGGLRDVVEAVTGGALTDRPALRMQRMADRQVPLALARSLLPATPWLDSWLDGVRSSGALARTSQPETAVRHAAAVLAVLLRPGPLPSGSEGSAPSAMRGSGPLQQVPLAQDEDGVVVAGFRAGPDPHGVHLAARTELAAALTGSSHALDDGTAAAALVLRALAAQCATPLPTTTGGRRALWERFGVRVDLVSTTCLTLGLRGGPRLALAADDGDPVHITAWDLRRHPPTASGAVLVCENPRVLEAIAERHGGRVPVVCTSGQPALVVLDVLRCLAGTALRYHGDFDWPGIAIANRLVTDAGVVPWRMSAEHYATALGPAGLPLAGTPVEPVWDAELGAAMRHHGVAVHEEAVLEDLLSTLS